MDTGLYDSSTVETPGDKNSNQSQKNYTSTKDPNVVIGKKGAQILRSEYEDAKKQGKINWNTFEDYADWVGGWATPTRGPKNISPYYRTYAGDNINGADIALLYSQNNPQVDKILSRNIAKPGEVPLFGSDDADAIRMLIKNNTTKYGGDPDVYAVLNKK